MALAPAILTILLSLTPKLIFFENGVPSDQCTGFAVHQNYVVTAAHCLPTSWLKGEPDSNDTSVAYFDPQKSQSTVRLYKVGKYFETKNGNANVNHDEDWAILELSEPLSASSGFFTLSKTVDSNLIDIKFELLGYPHNSNLDIKVRSENNCQITSVDNVNLRTSCEGSPGMSGGPMFYVNSNFEIIWVGIINNIQLGKKKWLSAIYPSPSLIQEIEILESTR